MEDPRKTIAVEERAKAHPIIKESLECIPHSLQKAIIAAAVTIILFMLSDCSFWIEFYQTWQFKSFVCD